MYLSNRGHDVHVVDNYLRRKVHAEAGSGSLTLIAPDLATRAGAWREVTGRTITVTEGDLTEWSVVEQLFREFAPEAIIHYGEQRAAPYSMIDQAHCIYTQTNNIVGTLNVMYAIADIDRDIHLVKLGTMGEYGAPGPPGRRSSSGAAGPRQHGQPPAA